MDEATVVSEYARLWWEHKTSTMVPGTYLGVPCWQQPNDAWITQEIISETRPEVIVECGRLGGGSTIMWAHLLEILEIDGLVVSIELRDVPLGVEDRSIWKRRVWPITGRSSVDEEVVEEVRRLSEGRRTMVILDSDHSQAHVEKELAAYAPLVSPGCYMIVQDGFVSMVDPDHGPGPYEATQTFLAGDERFEVDHGRERLIHTLNPSGFLRRR